MPDMRRAWFAALAVGGTHFALQWLLTGLMVGLRRMEQRGIFDVPLGWQALADLRAALDLLNYPLWIVSDRPADLALLYGVNSLLWGLVGAGLLAALRGGLARREPAAKSR